MGIPVLKKIQKPFAYLQIQIKIAITTDSSLLSPISYGTI
jgi:hypothetical protein